MFGVDDAIGAGAGLLGGIFGMFGSDPSAKYRDKSYELYNDINSKVNSRDVGDVQGTAYNQVDPATRQAMMGALAGLQNKYSQGGMDAIDRGRSAEIQAQQAQSTRQNQQAILQHARQTGTLNSGRALASQLLGAQGAGAAAATQSTRDAATAEQARMGTLGGIMGAAGQIQQGDFTVAHANDALNQFNKNLQVGNAERWQQAQQQTVGNELNRAQGIGQLANGAKGGNAADKAQSFLGGAGQTMGGIAKKNNWQIGGDAKADASDESAGLNMSKPNSSSDWAWNMNPNQDQRNY